jgi:hypothetical protein
VGPNDVVVETGAVDTHAPGLKNFAGCYWFSRNQTKVWWQEDLQYMLSGLRRQGLAQHGRTTCTTSSQEAGFVGNQDSLLT